jgi:colicin import membrane protein
MRKKGNNLPLKDRLAALAVPILIYGGIAAFVFIRFVSTTDVIESSGLPPAEIVQARTVDEAEIKKQEEEILAREEEKKKQEEDEKKRLEDLKKQSDVEEERITQLKKQQEEEKKKAEELEKQRLLVDQQRKQEEQKRLDEQRKREAEERARIEQVERERLAQEQAKRQKAAAEAEVREATQLFGSFEGAIQRAVRENWRRPEGVSDSLKSVFVVTVDQQGRVLNVRLLRSSGDRLYDESGIKAITFASPLPIPENPRLFKHYREFEFHFCPIACR